MEILELSNNIAMRMNAALPTDRRRFIEDMDEEVANIVVQVAYQWCIVACSRPEIGIEGV